MILGAGSRSADTKLVVTNLSVLDLSRSSRDSRSVIDWSP